MLGPLLPLMGLSCLGVCRRAPVVRALKDLEQSGVPASAEVVASASIATHLSETSKVRFELKFSPTGLCLRPIAGTVLSLDPCHNLPLLRHDEARRIVTAMRCTTWDNLDGILATGILPGNLVGGARTHIHLTTFCMGTRGFAEARGKRDVAVAVDLIKCLQRGVQLFVAGGKLSSLVGPLSLVPLASKW